jgi:Terminase large subunit, T4likevirus-type, N-terminal
MALTISELPGEADRPPRLRRVPPAARNAGEELCALAERLGLDLLPHQRLLLTEGSGAGVDGHWSSFINVVIAPRQVGKSAVLLLRVLGGLFIFGERQVLVSAHEARTTAELFRRLRTLINDNPWLGPRIAKMSSSHGNEAVELDNGARVQFTARSTSSGRGFSADLIVIDECHVLDGEAIGALLPTAAARGNAQIWACASAGTETSYVLAAWRDRALSGDDPGIALWEWSAGEGDRYGDPSVWWACNPGVPGLISLDYVRREHEALPADVFARERLAVSRWPLDERDRWGVISRAEWEACVSSADERVPPVSLGVGVDPVTRRAAAVVGAWTAADGLVHLGVADHRVGEPVGWVAPRLVQLAASYTAGAVAFDDRAAGPLGLSDMIGDAVAVCPKPAELAQACVARRRGR